jgi:5-methylcytosine-specific restriction endonuclease McrA
MTGQVTRNRDRAQRGGRGYDGVADLQIFARDKWVCMMPVCLCPDGTLIDRALLGTGDPWAPSVDHIVPLSEGGLDNAANKRAAHIQCNSDANSEWLATPGGRARQRENSRKAAARPPNRTRVTRAR